MRNFTKLFNNQIHKEIIITKNEYNDGFKVRMTFKVSNSIALFEGECKMFQINHEYEHKAKQEISFYAELFPERTRIVIKGACQIRTFVENDEIQKYVLEKLGTVNYE